VAKFNDLISIIHNNKRLAFKLALITTIIIVTASIIPIPEINNSYGGEKLFSISHYVSYLILSYLWTIVLQYNVNSINPRLLLIIPAIIPLTEVVQIPLPYRCACLEDLLFNALGAVSGVLLYFLIEKLWREPKA